MRPKQNMRRLVALTLATAVTLPQAGPVFAASPEIGKTAESRLEQIRLSTAPDSKLKMTTKDRFPLLSLPKTFQRETIKTTPVTKMGMESSRSLSEKVGVETQTETTPLPIIVTNGNNKLQIVTKANEASAETTDLVTELDKEKEPSLLIAESPPGTGELTSASPPESGGEEPTVDNRKTVGTEEITDVTTSEPDEGKDPLSGDVVMPPEANPEEPEANLENPEAGGETGGEAEDPEIPAGEGTEPDGEQPSTPGEPPSDSEIQPSEGEILPPPEALPAVEAPALEAQAPLEAAASLALERAFSGYNIYKYSIGYGVPLTGLQKYLGIKDYEVTYVDSRGNEQIYGRFQVELPEDVDTSSARGAYGSRLYTGGGMYDVYNGKFYEWYGDMVESQDGYDLTWKDEDGVLRSYCIFPSVESLGRVPDKVFDGWYLYPAGTKPGLNGTHYHSDAVVKNWEYGSTATSMKESLFSYGPEDPDYVYVYDPDDYHDYYNWDRPEEILYGDNHKLGDTWDRALSYDGYTLSGDPVSFVGRWRGSDESRAADVAIVKEEKLDYDTLTAEYTKLDSAVTLTAGGQKLKLYTDEIVGRFGSDLEALEATGFDRGDAPGAKQEYWLRVPADVDSLDLEFNAAEIFYQYNKLENKSGVVSPVKITWSYGQKEIEYSRAGVEGIYFTSKMLPTEWVDRSLSNATVPANSWDNPAYSRWSVEKIALEPSSQGKDGYLYNDITITVTPPSGDEEKKTTYIFHVQRLTEPTLTQSPGNTPMGMIARDTYDETRFDKAGAETYFKEEGKYQFSDIGSDENGISLYPKSSVNNSGTIFRDRYSPYAWDRDKENVAKNIDLDPEAIVVYQNSAFKDPGIALTDSEGRSVKISVDNDWVVYRKLKLKTADELSIPNLTKGTVCWYKGGELVDQDGNELARTSDTPTGEVLSSATDQIDLRGLKVLPGIYEMEYELYDPVADKWYDRNTGEGSKWVTSTGKAGAVNFVRTVVVLPLPGDVDMDGAVTSADAEILRKYLVNETDGSTRLNTIKLGENPTIDLFAYRVANIDHDDAVDNRLQNSSKKTDVDLLEALPRIQLTDIANDRSDYYYLPLPNEVEKVERRELKTNPDAEGAKLELVYLGKETGRTVDEGYEDGYFTAPNGPWKNGGAKIPVNIGENDPNRMQLFDTMWVGVKLTDGAADELLSGKGVDTFTFSLVYDVRYLKPTSVLTKGQLDDDLGASKDDAEERWKATLRFYNMSAGAVDMNKNPMTVWGTDRAYNFTKATQSERSFATYDSKAIPLLETAASAEGGTTNHLRELVFSITLVDGKTAIRMDKEGDQWLLAVPFTMIQYPLGIDEELGYRGVEMQAGMSDFTLVFQDGQNLKTAAYSPFVENDIFGGHTENLATHVTYANAGPGVPLGKDTSEVLYVRNEPTPGLTTGATEIVYSTEFKAQLGWKKNPDGTWAETVVQNPTGAGAIVRYAPDWLEFDNKTGIISGRPAAAGKYNFSIANYRYELVVEQAPLHYWAESKSSYYGESEFRSKNGEPSSDFTFRYNEKEIKSIELERADIIGIKVSDGLGKDLEALLQDAKYRAPEFTAVDRNGVAVSSTTVVSNSAYGIISTEAQSSNYKLVYNEGVGTLTILRRPLKVTEFKPTNVGRIFSDDEGTIYRLRVTLSNTSNGAEEFVVELADDSGEYEGRPLRAHEDEGYKDGVLLPRDSLVLQYQAELLQTQADKDQYQEGSNKYSLDSLEETRVAHISGLQIVDGVHSDCYTLGNWREPINNDKEEVVGTVRRRNIKTFNFVGAPPMEYAAGDQLGDSTALVFYIEKESDGETVREGSYRYNEGSTRKDHGVEVRWVTAEEKAAGSPGEPEYDYHDSQIFTMDYDGRYLCMSTENGVDEQGNPRTIVAYWETPLHITPRNLVLTAVESTRFYGEENGTLRFTYDPACLSVGDLETLRRLYGSDAANKGPRDGAELKNILNPAEYTEPKLSVINGVTKDPVTGEPVKGAPVTAKSNAGPTTYVVLIEGAWSKNYTVQYSYSYIDAGTRKTDIQTGWGATPFTIRRRPIVVDALRDTEATKNLATLYADTKRIFRTDLPLSMEDVVIGLPTHDTETTTYYPRYGATSMTALAMGYALGSSPILEEDIGKDKLSLEYRATMASQDGQNYVHWTSFSKGHFNMDSAEDGSRRYPVQVWYLTLKGSSAGNYELVYRDNTSATLGAPARWEAVTGCIEPGQNAGMTYYAPSIVKEESDGTLTRVGRGEGTVTLRPIEKIEIISTGMLNYTYGDTYTPNQPEANQRQGLRIHIEYLREETEDRLAGNVTTGEVDFRITGYTNTANGRVPVTTFDERGLKIYYQSGKETTDTDNCRELEYLTPLLCDVHDGKYLVVAGKRGSQTELIWSKPSGEHLVIKRRALTLRADPAHRVYGEANPASFSFSFDAGELASQDRAKLGVTSGSVAGSRLSELGLAYTAPVFATAAVKKSPVKDSGRSGYDVSMRTPGSLANYELKYEKGTLYIYPRLVQIERFNKTPIYTIYSDMTNNTVHDNLFINAQKKEFSLMLPATQNQYRPTYAPNTVVLSMTGDALVEGDAMTLRISVDYPRDWKNYNGSGSLDVTVTNAELLAGMEGYGNYVLVTSSTGVAAISEEARKAKGNVQLRRITGIRIQQAPTKTEYNYGETLDLRGLVVNIKYEEASSGATVEDVTIPYEYTDQFAAQGLYVNYYPSPTILPQDNTGPEAWAGVRTKYYTAATGDHVTIAPTHDSMTKAEDDPKHGFAANDKYLVVTAQRESQYGEGHTPAEPVLVRNSLTNELVKIKVNPRPLQFDLEANDKIYDATTQATGTLRLDNVFRQRGQVDATNANVTDMVYPVTGSDYEAQWGELLTSEGDQDFTAYIDKNGYRFTTGGEGYQYGKEGTMTFSFLDPNVAYVTEPTEHDVYGPVTTKEVQVKGLNLAGADARNYVLQVKEVTRENVAGIGDYLNSSHALPRATIQKADREPMSLDLLPTVAVDPNTNVVRVIYDQSKANIVGGENEQYRDELHFEYALQYADKMASSQEPTDSELPGEAETQAEEATLVVKQLAGMTGELLWWDETFYGGETVTVDQPAGYIPKEEDIPTEVDEDAVRKGQVYAWAEEDGRFLLNEEAYPGGASWPGYELYQTERTPLDRDRVYWPVVRVAETHNYNASPAISSVREYTPEMIQEVLDAQAALEEGLGDQESIAAARQRMAQAAEAVMAAMAGAETAARLAAQAESALLAEIAEDGEWPEEWAGRAPAAAVKTYAQRLELVSVEEMEGEKPPVSAPEASGPQAGAAGSNEEKYQVPTLEAVWFTDILEYGEKELLDAVVRNLAPVRYQDYAWDSMKSVPLFPEGESLSLKEPFHVTATEKDEAGNEFTTDLLVNQENTARIYVELKNLQGSGMVPVSGIQIDSDDLTVQIGDEPVRLRVIIYPAGSYISAVRWSSSDESVAVVDRRGVVSFVGVGTAVITATTVEGVNEGRLSDSITVTVLPKEIKPEGLSNSIFNIEMREQFFWLEEGTKLFHPQWEMTRGEAAQLLTRFYIANPGWTRTGPENFPDLTGEESYAADARLLGSLGVVMGLPDGSFGGEQNITRAEFVVLLIRMLDIEVPDTTGAASHAFLDTGEEDTWAYREIDAIKAVPGFVMGTGEGYFSPSRAITRAETAVFLTRLLQFPKVGENPVIPKDVGDSHWARSPIIRAVNQSEPLEE